MAAACLLALAAAPAYGAFADEEPQKFAKTNERFQHLTGTPAYQADLRQKGLRSPGELAAIATGDTERNPFGNLCNNHDDGCAGDVRLYDWDKAKGNIRRGPILWTARSGATISGHVWAVAGGLARKPGVVITNGSVQAPEQLYWPHAAALARAGYVVLTFDPQTQGRSDGPGEPPTQNENSSAQSPGAFIEGTQDAIDFFLSTPSARFRPRNSATNPSVNHAAKQNRRVSEGRNAAFNPLHGMLDRGKLGIAGHSLGALGVSVIASRDPRVDAVVAWDELRTTSTSPGADKSTGTPVPPRVPGLGMSGDYGIGSPNGAAAVHPKIRDSAPDPQGANGASRAFSRAGLATGQINTKGGTHFEYSVIPNPGFPATLRGLDQAAWYTIAWFDKYLSRAERADRLLLTNRWQKDADNKRVDPQGDANLYSKDLRSRIDVRRADRSRAICEDLRAGCGILVDDRAGPFSAVGFGLGYQSLRPIRPARCATRVAAPRRLDLSRAKRRLRVRLRLSQRTKVTLRAKRRRGLTYRRTRTLGPGARSILVKFPRRARLTRYRVTVKMRCVSGRQATLRRVTVRR